MMSNARSRVPRLAALHLLVWGASLAASCWVVERRWPDPRTIVAVSFLFVAIKGGTAFFGASFRELWRHTSLEDLVAMVATTTASSIALVVVLALVRLPGVSPAVAALDGAVTFCALSALRVGTRLFAEWIVPAFARGGSPVVLAGRPDTVDLELRRMNVLPGNGRVVGVILDGQAMEGCRLRRVPVLGREELLRLLHRGQVTEVRLVPPASARLGDQLGPLCASTGTALRRAPLATSLADLARSADPLLDRPSPLLDEEGIGAALAGRRVLLTGAGGSIGRGLARQLLRYPLHSLIAVDRSENALFQLGHELDPSQPTSRVRRLIADVRDAEAMERLFREHRPEILFHAAAHKHVPIVECHPCEGALNNVIGTRVVVDIARAHGLSTLVFISSDKAVRPTGVMGATKRAGELYVSATAKQSGLRYLAVRFGNVLGSSGSVLPIFIDQIQRGGPVTVTDPSMLRYFMSNDEACRLVLEAMLIGEGASVLVLDMGKPVRILDLARRLIEYAGLRADVDVPIVFTGPRPGEKLREELTLAEEPATHSQHPSISVVQPRAPELSWLCASFDELAIAARRGDEAAVRRLLREIVPEYRSASSSTAGRRPSPSWQDTVAAH